MTSSQQSDISNKLALITGCTGGIGSATALALARHGCSIAVHYHSAQDSANELVSSIQSMGVRATAFQADLSTYDGVRKLYAEVVGKMGHPNVLINNAGILGKVIGPEGDIQDISIDLFEHTWRTNTGTGFLLTQLCLPNMLKEHFGRIVFTSSVAAGVGGVIGPHYASSKAALHGLLHWISSRHAKDGITCNGVAPAIIIETGMMQNPSEELRKRIPVGRFGLPAEVASIIELLVTNGYMTNKIIVADGGWTATGF
ncbi:hypothetical protein AMATHDRAFT_147496 [Amanita thiersii Skay4041]|uniref:3-oxoacyl-[acyl-carrier-protein] reductase n=1 Tax=Amanita thiersii Skay4041 TaxID=703135 RepID=A0A2A9NP82_9AGAR|nr:hypothetical protein AMATHDRAFT_147496 [Amanita thiersii Skay4041]